MLGVRGGLEAGNPMSGACGIARLDVQAPEAAIDTPAVASFGAIPARVSAPLRVEDADGFAGWSEL